MKGRVALFTSNRAEKGLLEPVMKELEKLMPDIHPFWSQNHQHPDDLISGMEAAAIAHHQAKADFAIVPCDRQDMVGAALYLFYHNIPFAQLHAGDTGSGIHDEVGRWIISRCASLHFCNSPESAQTLLKSGEEPWRIHLVGSTAFDSLVLDDSIVPRGEFNLILIHPDTFSREQTQIDMDEALTFVKRDTPLAVVIGPNHDRNWEMIHSAWTIRRDNGGNMNYMPEGVPRPQFLALMKYCTRFITNSSSALYELLLFDISKWINIGLRNANRKPLETIERGGSKRIADIIRNLSIDDKLLRKQFV